MSAVAFATLRAYARVAPTERGGFRLARLARATLPRGTWRGRFAPPGGPALDLDLSTYPDVCMAVGLYELDTARLLRRSLRPGTHFVDVGANVGYFTLLAAALVGPSGRVDAVEPDPANRARLLGHLGLNGPLPQVRVHAVAASDAPGEVALYHPAAGRQNHGESSTLRTLIDGDATESRVPAARPDAVVDGVPDWVKVDCEGAELPAVRGMSAWLASPRPPSLVVEHNPHTASAAGHAPGDVFRAILSANGRYRCRWVGPRGRAFATPEALDGWARQGNVVYSVA